MRKMVKGLFISSIALMVLAGCSQTEEPIEETVTATEQVEEIVESEFPKVNIDEMRAGGVTVQVGEPNRTENRLEVEYTILNDSDANIRPAELLHVFWSEGERIELDMDEIRIQPQEKRVFTLSVEIPNEYREIVWNLLSKNAEDAQVEPLLMFFE